MSDDFKNLLKLLDDDNEQSACTAMASTPPSMLPPAMQPTIKLFSSVALIST